MRNKQLGKDVVTLTKNQNVDEAKKVGYWRHSYFCYYFI